jgi:hypothetical protein
MPDPSAATTDALRGLLLEASSVQSFLADVRQAMYVPAFHENQGWAREWHHRAQGLADRLAVAQEKASAALAGREPDPYVGSLHDAR